MRSFTARATGVELLHDQVYLLEPRVAPVAKQHGFDSIDAYVSAACLGGDQSPLGRALVDAMTTHETFFFRDIPFWRSLEEVVLPKLWSQGQRPLRVWSAACSSGQEAYSLAMLLEERYPAIASTSTIVASDVAQPTVDRAREGIFSQLEVNRGLGAARLLRHFEQAAGGFQIKASLRSRISWRVENLLSCNPARGTYDLVMCRNVLIYFGDADRRKVMEKLNTALRTDGFLGLGATESLRRPALAPGWFANSQDSIGAIHA